VSRPTVVRVVVARPRRCAERHRGRGYLHRIRFGWTGRAHDAPAGHRLTARTARASRAADSAGSTQAAVAGHSSIGRRAAAVCSQQGGDRDALRGSFVPRNAACQRRARRDHCCRKQRPERNGVPVPVHGSPLVLIAHCMSNDRASASEAPRGSGATPIRCRRCRRARSSCPRARPGRLATPRCNRTRRGSCIGSRRGGLRARGSRRRVRPPIVASGPTVR
jgi:hypothetical protein